MKRVFNISLVLFYIICGAILLRYSINSVYTYKQPIQTWVNVAKKWMKGDMPMLMHATESPIKLRLLYSDTVHQVLNQFVSTTFENGLLTEAEKKKLPGKIVLNEDTINVRFRLKGDYNDHRENNQWSYRLYLEKGKEVFGMNTFSLQSPACKGGLYEWLFYKALSAEGLIALQYHFVAFNDNNERQGLYALEESFDLPLLVRNNRLPGVILKLDESILINQELLGNKDEQLYTRNDLFFAAKIECFKYNRILKNRDLLIQYNKGKKLLEGFRRGELSLNQVFDIDQTAKLFALADLLGTQHGLMWKNVRFYYNPTTNQLELISYDSGTGYTFDNVMYNRWKNDKFFGLYADKWFGLFFSNPAFVNRYWSYLQEYTNNDWLLKFQQANKSELSLYNQMLIGTDAYRNNYFQYYQNNAQMIQAKIAERKKHLSEVNEYLFSATIPEHTDSILILNNSYLNAYYVNSTTNDSILLQARQPNNVGNITMVFNDSQLNHADTLQIHVMNEIINVKIN